VLLTPLRSVRGSESLFGTTTYRGLHQALMLNSPKIVVLISQFMQNSAHGFPRRPPLGNLVNRVC
jgi:hypothetical protein